MKICRALLVTLAIGCAFLACKKEPSDLVLVQLSEFGSDLPAANVKITLADVDTFTNTGPGFNYFNDYTYTTEDTLGATDAKGQLWWKLPHNFSPKGKVLFAHESDRSWEIKIGLEAFNPDSTLKARVYPFGFVKIRVVRQNTPDYPADYFSILRNNDTYPWRRDNLATKPVRPGESVEILAKVKGNVSNALLVEQHYNYYSTAYTEKPLTVFVAARDTAFREIVF